MTTPTDTLIELENKFWQAIVDQDSDAATQMLCEPSLMVSAHGALKFDHAEYRKMAEQGSMVLTGFELRDLDVLFPNAATAIVTYKVKQSMATRGGKNGTVLEMNDTSTWIKTGDRWRCVMHTETPIGAKRPSH